MNTQQRLIQALRARFPGESESSIARRAGFTPQRFANYSSALRRMDDDAIIGCAQVLELDVADTLAAHRAEHAQTQRERAFWRRFGAAASLAFAALLPYSDASATTGAQAEPVVVRCIMRNVLAFIRAMFRSGHGPATVLA